MNCRLTNVLHIETQAYEKKLLGLFVELTVNICSYNCLAALHHFK